MKGVEYQPRDNDERLALLGVCQFTNRTGASARLYADAFAAAPRLANDLGAGHRYNAARFAALAGCGQGKDAVGFAELERSRWRGQARQWLRDDLSIWDSALKSDAAKFREMVQQTLARWQNDTDLTGLREPAALEKLSAKERTACLALWHDIGVVHDRAKNAK